MPNLSANALAERLERISADGQRARIRRVTVTGSPLSSQQRRLWFAHHLAAETGILNLHRAIRIRGPLDVASLESAIAAVARRHAVLRARFPVVNGAPVQLIDGGAHETRFSDVPVSGAQALIACEAGLPFDLTAGPPFRSTIVHMGSNDYILLLTVHHIAADRWALQILLAEIGANYARLRAGDAPVDAEPAIRYTDFSHWQAQHTDGAFEYWKSALAGPLPLAEFPADHPSARDSADIKTRRVRFAPRLVAHLSAVARDENATLFMALFSAFGILLGRYSAHDEVLVGVPIAGRTMPELEGLVGVFVNALPLRIRLDESASFRELLRAVRETTLHAHEHQNIPYEALIEALRPARSTIGTPFFRTLFALQNTPAETLDLGLQSEMISSSTAATGLDFNVVASEGDGGIDCTIEYNGARYEGTKVERILNHFENLIASACDAPNKPIGDLEMLGPGERRMLLETWNATARPQPGGRRLEDGFAERARSGRDRVAVVHAAASLTYGELEERSNALACDLRAHGVTDGKAVGLCVGRSLNLIVATVAILKAGGACVPLDPASPAERLRRIVDVAAPAVILTEAATRDVLGSMPTLVLSIDDHARRAKLPPSRVGDENSLAYILFTSGSTGEPQGVMLEHAGFVNYIETAAPYGIRPQDRVLQFMALGFDVSVGEIWSTLSSGATMYLRDDEMIATPERFVERSRELGITVWILPTVYFHELAGHLVGTTIRLPPELRLIAFAGEAVRADVVGAWLRKFGNSVRLLNHYGPTEATIAVTTYECNAFTDRDAETTAIGTPIANLRCYILDARMRPVPVGVAGELYLAGSGIARGYLNNPQRTAERFIVELGATSGRMYRTGDMARYRSDGNIEFIGRTDRQLKIRGFRVELGEIEGTILEHPAIETCVVMADETGDERRLVAYVRLTAQRSIDGTELRTFIVRRLPSYMVPVEAVCVDSFPMTPSGKIDRRALTPTQMRDRPGVRVLFGNVRPANAPESGVRNILEVQLAGLFRDVLAVAEFGVEDDFFERGGHSLHVARLVGRIDAVCGERITMTELFSSTTPRRLAERIIDAAPHWDTPLIRIQDGTMPVPLFFLCGDLSGSGVYVRRLARALDPALTVFSVPPHGTNGSTLIDTPEGMAADYAAQIRRERPHGPYLIGGYCNGGVVAYEIARLLHSQGLEVGPVIIVAGAAYNSAFRPLRAAVHALARIFRRSPSAERLWFRRVRKRALDLLLARKSSTLTYGQVLGNNFDRFVHRRERNDSVVPEKSSVERLLGAYLEIMEGYVPMAYDGPVHLFWGDDDTPLLPGDPTVGWGAVATNLTVHYVPGDHCTVVTGESDAMTTEMRRIFAEWNGLYDRR